MSGSHKRGVALIAQVYCSPVSIDICELCNNQNCSHVLTDICELCHNQGSITTNF